MSLFLLIVGAVVASACSAPPPVRRDITLALVGEPRSALADDAGGRILQAAITETLVRRDREGAFVPRLALEVPTLANGALRIERDDASRERLVATFELRDARWQDGAPITTADVRFAFDEDGRAPARSERRWMADRVERVELIDARRVRFIYRSGERWELYPLAPRVMPAHLLEGASAERRAAYDREPVHAGPFAVAAWISGYGVTLSAFGGYVAGPAKLSRIEIRFYRDAGSVIDALRRLEVDVAPSPALDADIIGTLERFADRERLLPQYTPAMSVEMLRVGRRGALADPLVRRALFLTLDRGRLADELFAGRVRVPRSYLVAPVPDVIDALPAPRTDREAAAALLAQAGFVRGGLGVLQRGSERMAITLQVGHGSPARSAAAHRLATDLGAIGIAASVLQRDPSDVAAAVSAGDFDLALVPERVDDPQLASERYRGLVDPWFDVFLTASLSASDADRPTLYAELQRLWAAALAAIPIYQDVLVDVAPRSLEGVKADTHGAPLTWNVAEWRFRADVN